MRITEKLDKIRNNRNNQIKNPKSNYVDNDTLYFLLIKYFKYADSKKIRDEKYIIKLDEIFQKMIYGILQRYRKSLTIFYWDFFTREDKEDFVSNIKYHIYNKLYFIKNKNKIKSLNKNKLFSYFTVMIKNFIVWEYYKILKNYTNKTNFYKNIEINLANSWMSFVNTDESNFVKIKSLEEIRNNLSSHIINKDWSAKKKEFYNSIITVLHYSIVALIDYNWFVDNILIKKHKITSKRKIASISKNLVNIRNQVDFIFKNNSNKEVSTKKRKLLFKNYIILIKKLKLIQIYNTIDISKFIESFDEFLDSLKIELELEYYTALISPHIKINNINNSIQINREKGHIYE